MTGAGRETTTFDDSLLLAEALEQVLRGGTDAVTARTPAVADLAGLVDVARRVEASALAVTPTDNFRAAARARLMAAMRETAAPVAAPTPKRGGVSVIVSAWLARTAAAVSAVALAGAATASASATALPGDALYPIKQMGEQVALATARDDTVQRELLFQHAETRLDETSRLLEQGREVEADQSAERYTETIERAAAGAGEPAETKLRANQARLTELLSTAPPQAQPGLQRALAAAERGLGRARPEPQRSAGNAEPDRTSPSLIQAPIAVTAVPSPTPTATSVDVIEGAESRSEQSRRDATAPEAGDGERAAGNGAHKTSAGEPKTLPSTAVDKPRNVPVTPVQPDRRGRP